MIERDIQPEQGPSFDIEQHDGLVIMRATDDVLMRENPDPDSMLGKEDRYTDVIVARETGACAGVESDNYYLDVILDMAENDGRSVFINHELTHGADKPTEHAERGLTIVDPTAVINLALEHPELVDKIIYVFGAHGSVAAQKKYMRQLGITVYDLACPLVTAAERPIHTAATNGEVVVYLSDRPDKRDGRGRRHAEIVNALENAAHPYDNTGGPQDPVELRIVNTQRDPNELADELVHDGVRKIRLTSQTTNRASTTIKFGEQLSVTAANRGIEVGMLKPSYVCDAVEIRQETVAAMLQEGVEVLVVLSSTTSNNGEGYVVMARDIALDQGVEKPLRFIIRGNSPVEVIEALKMLNRPPQTKIGILASASTDATNVLATHRALTGAETIPEKRFAGPRSQFSDRVFKPSDPQTKRALKAIIASLED